MKLPVLVAMMILPLLSAGQGTDKQPYPTDYFRNPLDIPILLAGNFGECRPGHFHSGLDIKTQGKENLPVHAAAGGYISRIKTDKGGFGHAIYITHPNGYTTLYAHLNDYAPLLQKHLRKVQYERKRWDLDLSFTADQFPVRKGQQIAWSGNTGSSSAPHLHFEIRDSKTEHPLNPQLFGLQVTDNMPPVATEVVFYTGNIYERNLVSYTLGKKGNLYKAVKPGRTGYSITGDTIEVPEGLAGIGIIADDYMNGSDNTITFYTAELLIDDSLQTTVTLNDIGYDISRYIHAYTDYYARQVYKKWIQCLFKLPGNKLHSIFTTLNEQNGRVAFGEGQVRKVVVVLTDNSGNKSEIRFYARAKATDRSSPPQENCVPYTAGKANEYNDPNIKFALDERQLYDDICFSIAATPGGGGAISERFRLHYPFIPLHHYFDLQVKPNKTIPIDMRSKVVLMYTDGKDEDGRAAAPVDQGWYKASVRNFGTYWLAIDTVAPVIHAMHKSGANLAKAKQIALTAKDETTSVSTYTGTIDGKWVCFEQHGSSYFYEFDEHCTKGKHELVFKAADENGNEVVHKSTFTR
jgi:murein DD-endopeptidase MepM/ murein hydrolase activator NlpD